MSALLWEALPLPILPPHLRAAVPLSETAGSFSVQSARVFSPHLARDLRGVAFVPPYLAVETLGT